MSNCNIQFYSMKGCGYCAKAKTMFAQLINDGDMCVLPSSEAPTGVTAFPHFVSAVTEKSHAGLPPSPEALLQKLGHTGLPPSPEALMQKLGHTGLPPSPEALMQKLGHTAESFRNRCVVPQRRPEPFRNRCVVPQRRPEPFRQQPRASVWQKQYM